MVTYKFKNLIFMDDRLSIKYFFGTKQGLVMKYDVIMINKDHETFHFTQLNNNIKYSKTLIYLRILMG
jgi:hypothetical protein